VKGTVKSTQFATLYLRVYTLFVTRLVSCSQFLVLQTGLYCSWAVISDFGCQLTTYWRSTVGLCSRVAAYTVYNMQCTINFKVQWTQPRHYESCCGGSGLQSWCACSIKEVFILSFRITELQEVCGCQCLKIQIVKPLCLRFVWFWIIHSSSILD